MGTQVASRSAEFVYGFDNPRSPRRYSRPPEDSLKGIFEKWLNFVGSFKPLILGYGTSDKRLDRFYRATERLVSGIPGIKERSSEEIHAMVADYQDHKNIKPSGIFLSALYNTIGEDVIIYDACMDIPIDYLGIFLGDKTLIIDTNAGRFLGSRNKGRISNRASIDQESAYRNEGTFVNFGTVNDGVTGRFNGGTIVNCGGIYGNLALEQNGVAINFGKVTGDMGFRSEGRAIGLSLTGSLTQGNGGLKFGSYTNQLKECPDMTKYLEGLRDRIEGYRCKHPQEHAEVFDFLKDEIGDQDAFREKVKVLMN